MGCGWLGIESHILENLQALKCLNYYYCFTTTHPSSFHHSYLCRPWPSDPITKQSVLASDLLCLDDRPPPSREFLIMDMIGSETADAAPLSVDHWTEFEAQRALSPSTSTPLPSTPVYPHHPHHRCTQQCTLDTTVCFVLLYFHHHCRLITSYA